VAAPLRERLVFQVERGHAGPLEVPDGPPHVQGVAVPSVGVRDDGHAGVLDDQGEAIRHLDHGKQAQVGIPHVPGDAPPVA